MSEWQNTATDNIVLISESGTILATVFVRPNGWGAVVNWDHLHGASRHATDGRFLRGTWAAPDGAKAAVEAVLQAGTDSPLLQPTPNCAWKRIKRGMGYWRRDRGATLTVKQAASQAWYATLDGEQPAGWHPTAAAAVVAVEGAFEHTRRGCTYLRSVAYERGIDYDRHPLVVAEAVLRAMN